MVSSGIRHLGVRDAVSASGFSIGRCEGDLPADLRAAAALGGGMGRRLEVFDWAEHPLRDPGGWSPAVRASVAAALASRFPIVLWLGEELRLIYNDACIPVLGDKHPAALGRTGAQVWWDIWDQIGPMLAGVVRTGVATWSDDLMLMLVNDGRLPPLPTHIRAPESRSAPARAMQHQRG